MALNLLTLIQAGLYVLTIGLATIAIDDYAPKTQKKKARRAMLGSLLALFGTFFVTSLQIRDIEEKLVSVEELLSLDEGLEALRDSSSSAGRAAFQVAKKRIEELLDFGTEASAGLPEPLALELVESFLATEYEDDQEQIRVFAISPNIGEFKQGSTISNLPYEKTLARIAHSPSCSVSRIYILGEDDWAKVKRIRDRLESSTGWQCADLLDSLAGLEVLAAHHRDYVDVLLVGPQPSGPGNNDFVVVRRGSPTNRRTILGATRDTDGTMSVFCTDPSKRVEVWMKYWRELAKGAISVTKYEPPPSPPAPLKD